MADLTDVQSALVAGIAQTLYPNGTAKPSAVGAVCRVFAGWPVPASLDADMAAGNVQISVFATSMSRAVPQMMRVWQTLSITPTQLAASVAGDVITLSGTVTAGQSVVIQQQSGALAPVAMVAYAVQGTDTLTSIATALASQIAGASSSGAMITLPGGLAPSVVFALPATVIQEVGRQSQVFQVSVWAPNPALRASVASLIDPQIRVGYRLTMPDGTGAEIRYVGSADMDALENQSAYVRHLRYEAEFATTQTQQTTTVATPVVNLTPI